MIGLLPKKIGFFPGTHWNAGDMLLGSYHLRLQGLILYWCSISSEMYNSVIRLRQDEQPFLSDPEVIVCVSFSPFGQVRRTYLRNECICMGMIMMSSYGELLMCPRNKIEGMYILSQALDSIVQKAVLSCGHVNRSH